ncbi:MAG: protein-tyrosine phosphatase family protein [Gemmataceae bacterium]
MMTTLHWIPIPFSGRLAMAARPRGGDWLETELRGWKQHGVTTIVCLLTNEELEELELMDEETTAGELGFGWDHFPIPDRDVPDLLPDYVLFIDHLRDRLERGESLVIHCRQGIGRSGIVAANLLLSTGASLEGIWSSLSEVRGRPVPDTLAQKKWVELATPTSSVTP